MWGLLEQLCHSGGDTELNQKTVMGWKVKLAKVPRANGRRPETNLLSCFDGVGRGSTRFFWTHIWYDKPNLWAGLGSDKICHANACIKLNF